jgi:two-component system sensor histidine kinase YesM
MGPYANQQKKKISVLMEKTLWQKKYLINNEINNYQLSISSMMTNPLFTEPLSTILKQGKKDSAEYVNSLNNIFSEKTYLNDNIEGFFYLDEESNTYFSYNKLNIFDEKIYNFIKQNSPFYLDKIKEANGSLTFISLSNIKTQLDEDLPIILLGANFLDAQKSINRGLIFILINEKKFSNFLNPIYDKQTIYSSTYLLDNNDNIISSMENDLLNTKYNIGLFDRTKELLDVSIPLDKLHLNLLSVYSQNDLYGNNLLFIIIPLLITLFALTFTMYIIKNYINKITKYVSDVNDSMTINGDQLSFNISSNKELKQITHKFENMKNQLNVLLLEQKVKNKELLIKEEEKRIAEIKALEAQVNPHFIYNTLNTLNWIAIEDNNMKVSDAISDLASILRYSISHIHIMAKIIDEINWIKKYLNLQMLRYNNVFSYELNWDEELENYKIYKLLFQPYIENSIVHGFKDINYKGIIKIDIKKEQDNKISISIVDNGHGYDIKNVELSTGQDSANSRLKLYYKDNANIHIESSINVGTKVKITIGKIY